MIKRVSCDCKCKFNSTTSKSNQKWNNDICHCEFEKYPMCRKDYSWNPSTCIFMFYVFLCLDHLKLSSISQLIKGKLIDLPNLLRYLSGIGSSVFKRGIGGGCSCGDWEKCGCSGGCPDRGGLASVFPIIFVLYLNYLPSEVSITTL